ncbi:MAG: hypothetical protein LBL58_18525 [Tannerellaceae bacterium]|nr:hypothetical protein [Tannerellaceae bacterium]
MLKQAPRFTPFSSDRFPARKAYGARLTRIIVALRFPAFVRSRGTHPPERA